jgi:hypothetical protein
MSVAKSWLLATVFNIGAWDAADEGKNAMAMVSQMPEMAVAALEGPARIILRLTLPRLAVSCLSICIANSLRDICPRIRRVDGDTSEKCLSLSVVCNMEGKSIWAFWKFDLYHGASHIIHFFLCETESVLSGLGY